MKLIDDQIDGTLREDHIDEDHRDPDNEFQFIIDNFRGRGTGNTEEGRSQGGDNL